MTAKISGGGEAVGAVKAAGAAKTAKVAKAAAGAAADASKVSAASSVPKTAAAAARAAAKAAASKPPEMKIFGRWPSSGIDVKDAGIRAYITLEPRLVPKTYSRFAAKRHFYKSKLNIVERLINHLFVVGHTGKKHRISSGRNVGKTIRAVNTVIKAFEIAEKQTGKNPIEVLVRAVENAAPIEEVISYQKGGIFVREAVVTSPQRRVDMALRHLSQGAYKKSFRSKRTSAQALAEELIAAFNNAPISYAVHEKTRREKEATESR